MQAGADTSAPSSAKATLKSTAGSAAAGARTLVDQRGQAHAAHLERLAAEIDAVELDEVEGHKDGLGARARPQRVEVGVPVRRRTTASPSIVQEPAGSDRSVAAIRSNRPPTSFSALVHSATAAPSFRQQRR